ncbi:hypothetical protein CRG95_12595 [Escherichia sp. E4208]|nr:hypothetical protein CRT22_13800 [Escherichia sp. E5028]TGB59804.1 hypothetical protein CRI69_08545 [Escherichia sp. E4742]TGB66663.1 hypothetical protein CRG96_19165 [Escherichia sp. E4930]TGB69939.1 hypothetical protein CQB02_01900 [Escherichia coli]TGB78604.1 hypothetical protein CRI67_05290 [Escherichia sp. E4702]TGB79823.1 hypothetical protein CRI66_05040 [Escherichia sp. E4694]TGB84299.1 hypothetical protein CRG95_12595 [Escherichia sp. E4208]TGB84730.1 hypothetical protein CRI65_13
MIDYFIIFLAAMYIALTLCHEATARSVVADGERKKNVAFFPGWALVKKSRPRKKRQKSKMINRL